MICWCSWKGSRIFAKYFKAAVVSAVFIVHLLSWICWEQHVLPFLQCLGPVQSTVTCKHIIFMKVGPVIAPVGEWPLWNHCNGISFCSTDKKNWTCQLQMFSLQCWSMTWFTSVGFHICTFGSQGPWLRTSLNKKVRLSSPGTRHFACTHWTIFGWTVWKPNLRNPHCQTVNVHESWAKHMHWWGPASISRTDCFERSFDTQQTPEKCWKDAFHKPRAFAWVFLTCPSTPVFEH